jgi:cysteinyl-tRNA synthetase
MPQHTNKQTPASSPPRSVADVLCRELGARHPDGALKQIRTMKRLLRSHYRVQQRLEEYGVESLDEAVSHIASLTQQLETARKQQRERARRRLTVIETLLDKMDLLRAAPTSTSARDESSAPDDAPSLSEALDLVEALAAALDELRLELWLHQPEDASSPPPGAQAEPLLDRLTDALQQTQQLVDRLQRDRTALRSENERLRQKVKRLQQTVQDQQSRLQRREGVETSPVEASHR